MKTINNQIDLFVRICTNLQSSHHKKTSRRQNTDSERSHFGYKPVFICVL